MHSLLRYTLDLFGPSEHAGGAQDAPKDVANTYTHVAANRQVRLGAAVVGYSLVRARRRTIGFMVGPDGLVVRAPRWTPLYEIDKALQEKTDWILRKLQESRERQARQDGSRIVWRDGATLPFLGQTLQLQLDPARAFAAVGAHLDNAPDLPMQRTLRLGLPMAATAPQIRDTVQAWLMRQAQSHFTQRLDHFAPQLQVQWRKLSLSNATTRWGSAHADGSIRLNWRLIHLRESVIDYVVVHELSHLRVMNHGPQFWSTVEAIVPDYATLRKQLREDAVPKW